MTGGKWKSCDHLLAAFNNTDIHLAGDYEIQSAKNKIKIYFKCWDHHLLHKKIFFSVSLTAGFPDIHYLHNAISILFSEIELYASNSSMSDFILQWMTSQSTKARIFNPGLAHENTTLVTNAFLERTQKFFIWPLLHDFNVTQHIIK